ncbi:DUF7522 family protein [Natrarchaeobaculum aegyptiacum]|uniref:Roadblock/LAMTOR2 domain-containing protein n=1 Tax=Natrarchaeobaculum aegyptiacum TaxID=745377 RepID=A0A2Z2HPK0_9EURY|nr:hypothetical protein [Natrarchaeobaculum aegyptiacum]ARS88959.1 hypothetical protein B1756_03780 [Natrarchaeobaculum aegyptiacum]
MTDPDSTYGEVVAYARDDLGDDLRAVDYFDSTEYASLYIRDDVAGLYTESEFERMSVERMSNLLNVSFFEGIYDVGDFQYSVRRFDEALLIFIPVSDSSGLVISTEVDLSTSIVRFAEECFDLAQAATE